MHQGYIKLFRKIRQSALYKDCNAKQRDIMINLLLSANHKPNKWIYKGEEYTLKTGQLITSLESIANMCAKDVTIQNVRTALKKFEKYGFLTNESTNKNRLITIINWEFYQSNEKNQQTNQQVVNKQLTTNKNDNNEKNIYIDQLWSIYPCKKGKQKAYAKIPNLIEKYSFDELSRCIERYKLSVEHERKNGFESLRYMQGDTFFNGRYMDYLDCNYKGIENKLDEETKGKVLDFVIGE